MVCKIPFLHSLTVEWMEKMETRSAVLAVACFFVDFAFLDTFVFDVTVYYTGNIYTGQ